MNVHMLSSMTQCVSLCCTPVRWGSAVKEAAGRGTRGRAVLRPPHTLNHQLGFQRRRREASVPCAWLSPPQTERRRASRVGVRAAEVTDAPVFHLAFPVRDLAEAKAFYGGKLGLQEGRSSATWVDYSLYGHQIVCHEVKGYSASASANAVDGDPVPVPHMGLAMSKAQFDKLADTVRSAGVPFVMEPHLRFAGKPGEQWTMFFKDPSGNALEFKAMSHPENLFARYRVD